MSNGDRILVQIQGCVTTTGCPLNGLLVVRLIAPALPTAWDAGLLHSVINGLALPYWPMVLATGNVPVAMPIVGRTVATSSLGFLVRATASADPRAD